MTDTPHAEEPFTLASLNQSRRRRPWPLLALIATGAAVLIGAAGAVGYTLANREGPATSTAGAPPTASAAMATGAASETGPASSSSRAACEQLASLSRALPNDVFTAADLTAIKSVAKSAADSDSSSVAMSGQLLLGTVEDAVIAQGRSDEKRMMDAVTKYVRNLRKSCALAGFPT